MEQRFAIWAIARMVDRMVREGRFEAARAELTWNGVRVGRMTMGPYHPPDGGASAQNTITPKSLYNATKLALTSVGLTWDSVEVYGPPLPIEQVWMGAIAAAVRLFEMPDRPYEAFVGAWTGSPYTVFPTWWTTDRPSFLKREILIPSIVWATDLAKEKDYRAMHCVMRTKNGLYMGEGGYRDYGPRVTMRNSSDVTDE